MPARPIRVKVENEVGNWVSLPDGPQTLSLFGHGDDLLILCPGPDISLCIHALPWARRIFLLQSPEFADQMPAEWARSIPQDWNMVSLDQAQAMLGTVRVLHYLPATRLFPRIYAPLLASLHVPASGLPRSQTVLVPSMEQGLISTELCTALKNLGYVPQPVSAHLSSSVLRQHLEKEQPALFLSINFHGLDSFGENQALLQAADVPVVVWCVDNPFHLLTSQKNQLWKDLLLFVTDDWFVQPLRTLGAQAVHLPLATDLTIFSRSPAATYTPVSFVGRSQFPDRDRFFAACTVPKALMQQATALPGRQAHFGWWHEKQGHPALWPGQTVRTVGFGAEQTSALWRIRCLHTLAQADHLDIIGDAHWKSLIPAAHVRTPVDYYHGLAALYAQSAFSLNLTSLLLPHGLTQRHFDAWAAGGFVLTDNTPGLHIFPQELTAPVTFGTPQEAVQRMHVLQADPQYKEELRQAWYNEITTRHTYTQRLQIIVDHCAGTT